MPFMKLAVPFRRRQGRAATLLVLLLGAGIACGDDEGDTGVGVPALEIHTATSGPEPDPDGYTVAVDGGAGEAIGGTDTVLVDPLEAGAHSVTLDGIAGNCAVTGDNPATATVADGSTAVVEFAVVCGPSTGGLTVTAATTGADLDPDGYEVSVDGGAAQPLAIDGTVTLTGLALGTHSVRLGGLAANCQVEGANPVTAEVLAEATPPVAFVVVCTGPPELGPGKIAFNSNAAGLLAILVVNPDGTGLTSLTPEGSFESDPVWSPDGQRLLFKSEGNLLVMNADGTGREPLSEGRDIVEYRWSPDGTRIAFVQQEFVGEDVFSNLWVMQADGSGKTEIAPDASTPSWSPDSRSIAYANVVGQAHIRIVGADGADDRRLTDEATDVFQPAWSPTADEIVYRTLLSQEILLIDAAGGAPVNLTEGQGMDDAPVWSPDGQRIAFNTTPLDNQLETEVAVMNRDGTGRALVTDHAGFDLSPDWSPDGSRIVFVRSEESGPPDSEIYAVNVDGSDPINLSNRPESFETSPDWSGGGPGVMASRGSRALARLMEWGKKR